MNGILRSLMCICMAMSSWLVATKPQLKIAITNHAQSCSEQDLTKVHSNGYEVFLSDYTSRLKAIASKPHDKNNTIILAVIFTDASHMQEVTTQKSPEIGAAFGRLAAEAQQLQNQSLPHNLSNAINQ